MMYQDRLALAIKVQGKVLREFKDTVMVPFGSEYSLLIKNLSTVRALISIQIDGEDIADGEKFVVYGNSSIDIERFMKSGNKDRGQRFKFIERTSKIEEHRGIGIEDGLIRVEFEFESPSSTFKSLPHWKENQWPKQDLEFWNKGTTGDNSFFRNRTIVGSHQNFQCSTTSYASAQSAKNDVGITVGGSISEQKFVDASWFPTDGVKHVMVLKMVGEVGQQLVQKPITVKSKQRCDTCGHMNKSGSKFCSECGTGLLVPV